MAPVAEASNRYTFDRVVRMTLSAATAAAFVVLLRYLSDVLIPFAAAIVLAYLLNPLVTLMERRTRRRALAVAVTLGGLFVLGVAGCAVLIPIGMSQAERFYQDLEKVRGEVEVSGAAEPIPSPPTAGSEPPKSSSGWSELQAAWGEYRADAGKYRISQRLRRLRERVSGTFVGTALEKTIEYTKSDEFRRVAVEAGKAVAIGSWTAVTFAVNVVLALAGLVIVIVYLVFLLADFREYERAWRDFLPPTYRGPIVEFLEQFNAVLRRYLRGQAVVAIITGALYATGFTLIGLPMAVPLGVLIAFLNMVPYLPMVAVIPAMFFAALRSLEGDSGVLASVLLTLSVFGVVQVLQDTVVAPRVMGRATGLKPVAILLGVFVWGKLLGFLGVLLSIPLTCLGIAYYRRYVLMQERVRAVADGAAG